MAKDSNEDLDELIAKRIEIANTNTSSGDKVVQIAWLAKGIDLWHKSDGKFGHSPEDAMKYIISSVTRLNANLLHKQDITSRLDEMRKLHTDEIKSFGIKTYDYSGDRITSLEQELKRTEG